MSNDKKTINEIKRSRNDYLEVQNADGMPGFVDSTIAMGFLINAKCGIRSIAMAITEIADREARQKVLELHHQAIDMHAELTNLMLAKGWLKAYAPEEQFNLDTVSADTSLQIANLPLFPGDTSRLDLFATPKY